MARHWVTSQRDPQNRPLRQPSSSNNLGFSHPDINRGRVINHMTDLYKQNRVVCCRHS